MPVSRENPPHSDRPSRTSPMLDYASARKARRKKNQIWRGWWFVEAVSVPRAGELRKWWGRRVLYYLLLFSVFIAFSFYCGPNLWHYGRLTRPTLSDFVPLIQRDCVPAVRAMKTYEREHGHLPESFADMAPGYLFKWNGPLDLEGSELRFWPKWNHLIIYDFTKAHEGWTITGPIANGIIPLPPVTVDASTQPAH